MPMVAVELEGGEDVRKDAMGWRRAREGARGGEREITFNMK